MGAQTVALAMKSYDCCWSSKDTQTPDSTMEKYIARKQYKHKLGRIWLMLMCLLIKICHKPRQRWKNPTSYIAYGSMLAYGTDNNQLFQGNFA